MIAVGLIRVSTDEQARDGYSLDAQRRAIAQYAEAQGWELGEIYADEGVRGKSGIDRRPNLQRLVADGMAGNFERVIVWKLDRLSRLADEQLRLARELLARGIHIASITEPGEDILLRAVYAGMSAKETEQLSERIKVTLAERVERGLSLGRVPLGYRRVWENSIVDPRSGRVQQTSRVEVDPVAGPLVRELFERFAGGSETTGSIIEWADRVGLRTYFDGSFSRATMIKLIKNRAYLGIVKHRGVEHAGVHEPLVSVETFEAAQRARRTNALDRPARRPWGRRPYPLSGIAHCECGSPLAGISSNGYRYMRCSSAMLLSVAHTGCTDKRLIPVQGIEAQVADYIAGIQINPNATRDVMEDLRRRYAIKPANSDMGQLKTQLTRLKRLYLLGDIDDLEYTRERKRVRTLIDAEERPAPMLDFERALAYLANLRESLADLEPEQLRSVFVRLLSSVKIADRQIVAIRPQVEFEAFFVMDRKLRFGQVGPLYPSVCRYLTLSVDNGGQLQAGSGVLAAPAMLLSAAA